MGGEGAGGRQRIGEIRAFCHHWLFRRPAFARYRAAMQTENPFFDGLAKFFTDAAGAANALRDEIDTFVRQRLERLAADMDLVPREEFEAVKAMAAKARSENEALAMRVAELEKRSAGGGPSLGR